MLRSINPFNQRLVSEYPSDATDIVAGKIARGAKTFLRWKAMSFDRRAVLMTNAARVLRQKREQFARMITIEMGKAINESRSEIDKCANACEYFASEGEKFLREQIIGTEASRSYVTFQPLGPVLAIMPWNFPFWQVFRFAAPALMAGNVGLLKHASNVTGCSLMIQSVFEEAGFPEHTFQSLLIGTDEVERVIAHDHVAAVTLTGSEKAGSIVASMAGRHLKKQVLELGGSDPFIVLEDADLSLAANIACKSRMQNAGQSCIAAKRFIVIDSIKSDFLEKFSEEVKKIKTGDPLDEETTMGLMARIDLAAEVQQQVNDSIVMGATRVVGGAPKDCLFPPTIVDNVKKGQRLFDQEVFGPVASIISVKDEAEAIRVANDHRYGLGSSIWTGDNERGRRVAAEIQSGCVFINSMMRSDQRLPFGGIKKSGYGRELAEPGIKEFTNIKSIFVG